MSLEHDREDFSKFQHESIRKIIKYENSKLKKFNQILAVLERILDCLQTKQKFIRLLKDFLYQKLT